MASSSNNNSYEPPNLFNEPELSKKEELPVHSHELASLYQRFFGSMIDGFITMTILLPIMLKMGLFENAESVQTQIIVFLLGFLSIIIIHGYFLYTRGQSIGKMLVGTQIVGLNGRLLSLERIIFLRYMPLQIVAQIPVIGQIIAIFDAIMIFNPDRRCLHDHIASTVVVQFKAELLKKEKT